MLLLARPARERRLIDVPLRAVGRAIERDEPDRVGHRRQVGQVAGAYIEVITEIRLGRDVLR